jgi:tetratricopeptide (TPR) repeat protein
MKAPRRAAVHAALAAVLAAGALIAAARSSPPVPETEEDYSGFAAQLFDRDFDPQVARGPLFPAFLATSGVLQGRLSRETSERGQLLLWAAMIAAAFGLASRLGSAWGGAFAAAGLFLDPGVRQGPMSLNVYFFYGFCVLALAVAAEEWSETSDAPRTALVGFTTGLVLICRSALLAWPPLFVLTVLLRRRLAGRRRALIGVFALGIAAALAPWTARNAVVFRRFIPLEDNTFIPNLMSASLGRETPMEFSETRAIGRERRADFDSLAPDAQAAELKRAIWENIREHPRRYLATSAHRFTVLWSNCWMLIALAGLCLLRPTPSLAALGLLWLSFNLYALVGVRPFYADSARPLLWVLAAGGLEALARLKPTGRRWKAPGRVLLGLAGAVFLAYGAWMADEVRGIGGSQTLALSGLKPDAPSVARIDAALKENPRNFRYWNARGVLRFLMGRAAPARDDFAEAVRLNPRFASGWLDLGVAQEKLGDADGARKSYDEGLSRVPDGRHPELRLALWNARAKLDAAPRP